MSETATEEKHAALNAFIASLEFSYTATFVPQSASRNASEENKSLNWRVALERGGRKFATDYMQGIGHVPGYVHGGRMSYEQGQLRKLQDAAAESGKYPDPKQPSQMFQRVKALPVPELRDILYSLVQDASVLNSSGFEDWASELGYDTDSRKAEATYRACVDQSLAFKALIGEAHINKLQELFQDY